MHTFGLFYSTALILIGQRHHALLNPATAAFVVVTDVFIAAAQKGAAHAPGGAVVVGCRLKGDLAFP